MNCGMFLQHIVYYYCMTCTWSLALIVLKLFHFCFPCMHHQSSLAKIYFISAFHIQSYLSWLKCYVVSQRHDCIFIKENNSAQLSLNMLLFSTYSVIPKLKMLTSKKNYRYLLRCSSKQGVRTWLVMSRDERVSIKASDQRWRVCLLL